MWHKRWVWTLRDTRVCEIVLGIILESRLKEGFVPINTGVYSFFKEITLYVDHEGNEEDQNVPALLQYIAYLSHPNTIVLELWLEPQSGVHKSSADSQNNSVNVYSELQMLDALGAWFYESDTNIISALTTFNFLGTISTPNQARVVALPTSQSENSPPISLDALVLFADCTEKRFPMLFATTTEGVTEAATSNKQLYELLATAIHRVSSFEVNIPNDSRFKGFVIYAKALIYKYFIGADFLLKYVYRPD